MHWYSTCLVFHIRHSEGEKHSFFEELWLLLQAPNEQEAAHLAHVKGHSKSETLVNVHGERLDWKFQGIRQLQQLELQENCFEIMSLSTSTPGFVDQISLRPSTSF